MRVGLDIDEAVAPWRAVADLGGNPETDVLIVTLDGVEQHNVIEVDSDAGVVRKYVADDKGNLVESAGQFVTVTLRGAVVLGFRAMP